MKKVVKCISLKEKYCKAWSKWFTIGEVYDVIEEDEHCYLLFDKDENEEIGNLTWWVDKENFIVIESDET